MVPGVPLYMWQWCLLNYEESIVSVTDTNDHCYNDQWLRCGVKETKGFKDILQSVGSENTSILSFNLKKSWFYMV
ncbi:hypothetical protein AQUCO_05400081v1 [Aquilegia coerulea]|uniref:Uncharacterized protein n=1 Tax=Aquilegia coerulea TaxID=218851 RepID=A0A2G5CHG4_AQUCA|nr:hypothetical protein AQUCO_05400081v1 [Aquilegia coerulea]